MSFFLGLVSFLCLLAVGYGQAYAGLAYTNSNGGGTSISLYNTYVSSLGTNNNKISSIYLYIPGNYLDVWSGTSKSGSTRRFRTPIVITDLSDYSGWNDQIESYEITYVPANTYGATLFEDGYLGGFSWYYPVGSCYDLSSTLGNDKASSLYLFAGTEVYLYPNSGCSGTPVEYHAAPAPAGDLTFNSLTYNDVASSFKVQAIPPPPPPTPPPPTPGPPPPDPGPGPATLQSVFTTTNAAAGSMKRDSNSRSGTTGNGHVPNKKA